jgi:purine-binding chemotaxis protein CheW
MTGEGFMRERAADLRRAFDHTFSEPPVGDAEDTESLLALRAGGEGYAVRLAEITGLFADRTIVRLPSPVSEFLGVAGLRHDVVPVYSLPSLLGYAIGGDRPRWLITARATHALAFAFEQFEGYQRVPVSAVHPSNLEAARAHACATVRLANAMHSIVSIASLVKTIEDRIRHTGTIKEQ